MNKLHNNLNKVEYLIGKWRGKGKGIYPTIKSFEYGEEIIFTHVGKPFIYYYQKTWNLETGAPMHSESGYIRFPSSDKAELILSQPTGIASVEEGEVRNNSISLFCKKIQRSETSKHPWVIQYNRKFDLGSDGTLHYTMDMQTETQPLQRHLEATLIKVNEETMNKL
jgi:hypothetical protein